MLVDLVILLLFPAAMAFAAASDLVSMTISNRLNMALAGMFLVAAIAIGMDPTTMALHVACGALVLVVGFACFAMGWMGGGDAKLLAVTALWFGFGMPLAEYLMISAVFGGLLTLGILFLRGYPLPQLLASQGWVMRLHDSKTGIPYGIALAAGALVTYPGTFWFAHALR